MKLVDWFNNKISALEDGKIVGWQDDQWGHIMVIDHGHLRILNFDSQHEQSRLDKNHPTLLTHNYTRAMMIGLAFIEPKHITLLGLGGGCMLRTLHSLFSDVKLDVVELRQAVVDLAQQFFKLPEAPQIEITVADAKVYLKDKAASSTDLIFADMFHAWGIELFQTRKQFLNQASRVLSDKGWLVINYHDRPDPESAFFVWMNELFEEVLVCPVPYGNYIVYAGKSKLADSIASYFHRLEPIQKAVNVNFEQLFKRLERLDKNTEMYQTIR